MSGWFGEDGLRAGVLGDGGFAVDLDELHVHTRYVDGLAARMAEVSGAAQPLGLHAYGLVGQAFARTTARTAAAGSATVDDMAQVSALFGERLLATAQAYRRVDEDAAAGFRDIG